MPPRTPPPTQPDSPYRQQVIAEDNSIYHHTVGAPRQIPAGEAGEEDKNPGPWAEYVMMVPWKVARNARKLKT
ncbi:hypothetical protein N7519_007735 [Penicillium mononematosum]|uniref:uncharacterized protein n=1 Tax=Penicillium mononematosum TaxID=268346 RepID=UPI00254716EB|nr:uncharacterized protein N7519_007735 [Penicillium mononematosum]KAJ6186434.1 hypothetical protein N7519_007735 [Penicillium mononematosum]